METVGINVIIRTLEKEAATGEYVALRVTTHPEAALYLLNEKRAALQALEARYNVSVSILMDASIITGQHRLVKVTSEGKEITHENSKGQQQDRGGRGGQRRGRRGGQGGGKSGGVNFDNAVTSTGDDEYVPTPSENPDDDIFIGTGTTNAREVMSNSPPAHRANRASVVNVAIATVAAAIVTAAVATVRTAPRAILHKSPTSRMVKQPQSKQHHRNSTRTASRFHAQRVNGNRRRGRRGGRNRNRSDRPRREEGSIGNPVQVEGGESSAPQGGEAAARTYQPRERKPREDRSHNPAPVSYSAPQAECTAAIVGDSALSEKQTNPSAVASPIISQSSGGDDKSKKKGWWSRVLEN